MVQGLRLRELPNDVRLVLLELVILPKGCLPAMVGMTFREQVFEEEGGGFVGVCAAIAQRFDGLAKENPMLLRKCW